MSWKDRFDRWRKLEKKYQDKASRSMKDMRKRRRSSECE